MPTFRQLIRITASAYTGRSLKYSFRSMGLAYPANITTMYLNGEHPEYICRAVLCVNQIGE